MNPALPVDAALPRLREALDANHAGALLAAHASGCRLLGCRVDRIKYRPGRNLAVSYLLSLQRDGRALHQHVATRWCTDGDAARRAAKARTRALTACAAGPDVTHDATHDVVAHWWPNDPKLAAARTLVDDDRMRRRWLPEVVASASAGAPLRSHALELVQLVPEHRVTARALLELADGRTFVAYGKADAETRGPRTHDVMEALWRAPAQRDGRLRTPRPLLWQAESHLHWQAALPGTALLDRAPELDATDAARVGVLLAGLHASAAAAAPAVEAEALRQRAVDVAATLTTVQPALAARVQRLALALARGPGDGGAPVTLHGDLHPRNVLVDAGGRLGFIDLDSARRGPALLDLGAWVADTLYRSALSRSPLAPALESVRAFLDGYHVGGGGAVEPRRLAWAAAYQLLCQRVWRCMVNLKPGRYALVEPLLAMADRIVAGGHVDAAVGAPEAA